MATDWYKKKFKFKTIKKIHYFLNNKKVKNELRKLKTSKSRR